MMEKIWRNIKREGLENDPWKENFYGNAGSDDFSESIEKVGKQIQESIELNQGIKGAEAKKMALEMLEK